ncbi:molybdopterin molybdotransferase MoeA [Leucobacter sp. USHLN153]|uniref:molybdopterin molybdotransferase MoeA n=1 Tax=Leucobacter sp. USHLN153 TaxID=3081268 RepID=UPI0030165AB5
MRSHTEHAEIVRELLRPVLERTAASRPEKLRIADPELVGRVAACDVLAAVTLPPFDNSQMDGYAVRAADLSTDAAGPVTLPIGRTTAAGDAPIRHEPGTAAPVMTGAAIPIGADAVIPIEHADPPRFTELRRAGGPAPQGTVSFSSVPAAGTFVRRAGSDRERGAQLVAVGRRLTPARIGLLAHAGVVEVAVRPRLRILLVSTGDEVAEPGSELAAGRVYDANSPLLAAALREVGAAVECRRVADSPESLRALIARESPNCDLIVTSGGISAGAFEVVRDALERIGASFAGLALQPGGPQGCGVVDAGAGPIPVLCFPGNPVSSALSFELFLRPLLREYAGARATRPVEERALAHDVESPAQKHQVRRGRIDADGRVVVSGPSSHLLADLADAEVLAHIPRGVSGLRAGDHVEVWRIDD